MYAVALKPYMHAAITVGFSAFVPAFFDLVGKRQIPCRFSHSFDIVIVATS